MKPNDAETFDKEAYIAHQLAIVAKYTKVKLEPKPTAEQKAERAWKKPLQAVVKANSQSEQVELKRVRQELEEAEARRARAEYISHAQIANERAVELGFFQRQMEALAERRYDPTGNWGRPNYKTNIDD
jgi:hypothetical protein